MQEKITQTAGREQLGEFAPTFAHLNDDVLFGEVWNEKAISLKTKCIVTLVALMASGITDTSLTYHIENAKAHGVTKEEISAIITHAGMYVGWPKAWAVFRIAKSVYGAGNDLSKDKEGYAESIMFPIGKPNDAFKKYFIGQSYLAPLTTDGVGIYNVTFEPGCRNNKHVHHAKKGGGQILICVGGKGVYCEEGKDAVEMNLGDVINIPAGVKHWHGATADGWFSHLAIEVPGEEASTEWCEPVGDDEYLETLKKLKENENVR